MRLIGAAGGNERDGFGLMAGKFDLAFGRGAGSDPRVLEEARRSEIVATPRAVDEGEGDRPPRDQLNRLGGEAEAVNLDDDLRGLGVGGTCENDRECGGGSEPSVEHVTSLSPANAPVAAIRQEP